MNPLEIHAMLSKIQSLGGTIELIDENPVARKVPPQFFPFLKSHRAEIIKILSREGGKIGTDHRKTSLAERSCKKCRHGNDRFHYSCLEPFKAGLAEKFEIAWHDRGGIGCAAFDDR